MLLGFRFLAVGSDYSLGGKLPIVMEFPTFCPHTWMGFCSGCYLPWQRRKFYQFGTQLDIGVMLFMASRGEVYNPKAACRDTPISFRRKRGPPKQRRHIVGNCFESSDIVYSTRWRDIATHGRKLPLSSKYRTCRPGDLFLAISSGSVALRGVARSHRTRSILNIHLKYYPQYRNIRCAS